VRQARLVWVRQGSVWQVRLGYAGKGVAGMVGRVSVRHGVAGESWRGQGSLGWARHGRHGRTRFGPVRPGAAGKEVS